MAPKGSQIPPKPLPGTLPERPLPKACHKHPQMAPKGRQMTPQSLPKDAKGPPKAPQRDSKWSQNARKNLPKIKLKLRDDFETILKDKCPPNPPKIGHIFTKFRHKSKQGLHHKHFQRCSKLSVFYICFHTFSLKIRQQKHKKTLKTRLPSMLESNFVATPLFSLIFNPKTSKMEPKWLQNRLQISKNSIKNHTEIQLRSLYESDTVLPW